MTHARTIALACALACIAPATARAQSADAETLFQDGRRLLKEGKLDEACAKLEASERLEASVGTLLNLADCREKRGQVATAWATFLEAAGMARRASNDERREKEATRRAHALESRVPYLTVSVPSTSQVEGLTIARAGEAVDPALWNTAAPVDPGTYTVTAQAPGRDPWSTQVVLAEGQRLSIEVPRFPSVGEMTPPKPPAPTPPVEDASIDAEPPPPPPPVLVPVTSRWTSQRRLAVGIGVFSLASIGGGIALGINAQRYENGSDHLCGNTGASCDNPIGLSENKTARRRGHEADALLAAGGLAAAGAAVLWFLGAPHALEVAPVDSGATLSLAGRF